MNWPKYLKLLFDINQNNQVLDFQKQTPVDLYFPLLKGKMYGGSIMADALCHCLVKREPNMEILKFNTRFYYPTDINPFPMPIDIKKGKNFRFTNVNFYTDKTETKITSTTYALLELNSTEVVENIRTEENTKETEMAFNKEVSQSMDRELIEEHHDPNIPPTDLAIVPASSLNFNSIPDVNPSLRPDNLDEKPRVENTKQRFDTFMFDFFKSIDKDFMKSYDFLNENSGFLSFIQFLTTSYDLKVESINPLRISYSIDCIVPDPEVIYLIVYLVDILMVCFASIQGQVPIHDIRKISISSIEHQMNFVNKMDCSVSRKGVIECFNDQLMKRGDCFFVNAQIFGSQDKVFCHVFQLLLLLNLKSKL